jgi:hypothetical protein
MFLSMEKYYQMFEDNIVISILNLQYNEGYFSIKLEYLKELQQVSGLVSSIVNLDSTLQTLLFPSVEDGYSTTINVYYLNDTCDYFITKTLSVSCRKIDDPIDKTIFEKFISINIYDSITNEKHIKKLSTTIKGFDFFYPNK